MKPQHAERLQNHLSPVCDWKAAEHPGRRADRLSQYQWQGAWRMAALLALRSQETVPCSSPMTPTIRSVASRLWKEPSKASGEPSSETPYKISFFRCSHARGCRLDYRRSTESERQCRGVRSLLALLKRNPAELEAKIKAINKRVVRKLPAEG